MSWDLITETWVPDDTDYLYIQLLFTSRQNLQYVVSWLEKLAPPWRVYVYCFEDNGRSVEEIVQYVAALDVQGWSLMFVTSEHRKEFYETEFPVHDYLDSRLRIPR